LVLAVSIYGIVLCKPEKNYSAEKLRLEGSTRMVGGKHACVTFRILFT
jgi:hypothetical protein